MIINHKHRFIFIKTRKTAGTSIEIALSRLCGSEDVITPITEDDESKRLALGFRGPQNSKVPPRFYKGTDWLRLLARRKPKLFFNHAGAEFIRENIGAEIWDSYFKFCFERDPFDKAISRYYWSTEEPRPEISDFLDAAPIKLVSNWDIYTINDQIAVDFVGRFENLIDDLTLVSDKLNLPAKLSLPQAKGGWRKDRQHYSRVLDTRARARIELVCAKEIAALNYQWREPRT